MHTLRVLINQPAPKDIGAGLVSGNVNVPDLLTLQVSSELALIVFPAPAPLLTQSHACTQRLVVACCAKTKLPRVPPQIYPGSGNSALLTKK
jgi:hypothetical protein